MGPLGLTALWWVQPLLGGGTRPSPAAVSCEACGQPPSSGDPILFGGQPGTLGDVAAAGLTRTMCPWGHSCCRGDRTAPTRCPALPASVGFCPIA